MSKFLVKTLVLGLGVLSSLLLGGILSQAEEGLSHARIVRLSFVEGDVTFQQADAPEGGPWGPASVNIPMQAGFKLATGTRGFAEVEFENGSTVRLGELSKLHFDQLALLVGTGGMVTRLSLRQGYATFNLRINDEDIFDVRTADTHLAFRQSAQFRVDLDGNTTRVAVSRGRVNVTYPKGSVEVGSNHTLLMDPQAESPLQLSAGITEDDWDRWNRDRDNRPTTAGGPGYGGVAPGYLEGYPAYGTRELYESGTWTYVPGYGYSWIPPVGYGWSPYMNGYWASYPNYGSMWISYYPWGWLPYRSGTWGHHANFGWFWSPGFFGGHGHFRHGSFRVPQPVQAIQARQFDPNVVGTAQALANQHLEQMGISPPADPAAIGAGRGPLSNTRGGWHRNAFRDSQGGIFFEGSEGRFVNGNAPSRVGPVPGRMVLGFAGGASVPPGQARHWGRGGGFVRSSPVEVHRQFGSARVGDPQQGFGPTGNDPAMDGGRPFTSRAEMIIRSHEARWGQPGSFPSRNFSENGNSNRPAGGGNWSRPHFESGGGWHGGVSRGPVGGGGRGVSPRRE